MRLQILGLKVSGRTGDNSDFKWIDLDDVNYINLYRPSKSAEQIPVYHTSGGDFIPVLTLKDLSQALKPHGFIRMEKSTIVNRNRIKARKCSRTEIKIEFVDSCELSVSRRSRIK
ncbi:LytTR family DNA-binding domain-containing protein [Cohnella lubricantis]|uniref:LytTR family transcriptional regulator DNA-binding domain-containing protein n=1 Tax=Cohnella lubricantis TaxID=2163172 RepID=A0A841TDC9_9BACL|nr:LytTR family transcriptional regulator DNA-binding domain-containing protein [Cohnella lubricantis]